MSFLVEVKQIDDDLKVGDLLYYKGWLLKVQYSRTMKSGTRVNKFRRIGRVRLKPGYYDTHSLMPHLDDPKVLAERGIRVEPDGDGL